MENIFIYLLINYIKNNKNQKANNINSNKQMNIKKRKNSFTMDK